MFGLRGCSRLLGDGGAEWLAGLGLDADDDRFAVDGGAPEHEVVIADVAAVASKLVVASTIALRTITSASLGWVASAPSRSSGPDQAAASVGALVPGLRFLPSMWLSQAVWFGSGGEASVRHEKRIRRW